MQKLNVNYSSDPPLQSREIIALLATGRDPNASAGLASSQVSGGGFVGEAGSGLLGQAVAAQLSSRVQRFFGASRVKIDPQLGGVENLPQARLTLEQQVSKDITLTYITNLNRTQEQLVQSNGTSTGSGPPWRCATATDYSGSTSCTGSGFQ